MIELVSNIPIWIWVLGGLITFTFVFGDKKLWEFEAKFPLSDGVGRGEVELESKKKRGTRIECKFDLDATQHNKPLAIYLEGRLIFSVPASANTGRFALDEPVLQLAKPKEGDLVTVQLDGREVFSAPLVLD